MKDNSIFCLTLRKETLIETNNMSYNHSVDKYKCKHKFIGGG